MTIKLIDQSLNIAITSLIYGSEIWLTCAFSLYLARRIRLKAKAQNTVSTDSVECSELAKTQFDVTDEIVEKSQPDATIENPVDKAILAEAIVEPFLSVETHVAKPLPLEQKAANKRSVKKEVSEKEIIEKETLETKNTPLNTPLQISCEPVNWNLWKVGDLRKASIYRACGVRIRPIGSRKNLPKANLIAQYEQNLKRLTKMPPVVAVEHQKTA